MSRIYRRTLGTRLVGGGCVLLFTGGAVSCGLSAGASPLFLGFAGLSILSLVNLAGAFGDRYILDEAGIEYRSGMRAIFGRPPRRIAWEEVARVREHRGLRAAEGDGRPSVIVLTLRSGGRLVLDSLQDFETIRDLVRSRCPQ